ncbi:cytidine deaminase [Micromonospora sp. NBC_01796]|uniref:cytidine deaminase n=1 Tax=Micromonospora sp. NBC_01796 TaxID=2975987 RepID=UPI002DD88041|nr:cytidine deaminase [Micromonospora sp. NBC_01796]WSA82945.1 cytidine deaminase [Micromonospora sp. NBC_01796]
MPESYAVSAAAPAGPIGSADVSAELSAEDAKLVVLARGARARIGAVEGAAVRDQDGRTYAAASVSLPSLTITALQLAVASAAAAGASRLEAAAVVTEASTLDGAGHAAVRDLAAEAPIHVAAPNGTLLGTVLA